MKAMNKFGNNSEHSGDLLEFEAKKEAYAELLEVKRIKKLLNKRRKKEQADAKAILEDKTKDEGAKKEAEKILRKRYGEDAIEAEELMLLTGYGLSLIRNLMNARNFPAKEIGNGKMITISGYVKWSRSSERFRGPEGIKKPKEANG